ncbi:MAG: SGNH/GDSL hydrolase family protein [Gemmatimonadaceae bacterium]
MHHGYRPGIALALAVSTVVCAPAASGPALPPLPLPPVPANALRVLFVGNSLTYANDLPHTVADLAQSAGKRTLYAVSVAFPDYALEDHLAQGDASRLLKAQDWDFVVLQQGPTSLASSRALLERDARRFAPLIAGAKAKPALFMVWPTEDRKFAFNDVRDSYRAAAIDIEGLFMPAGMSWLEAWKRDSGLILYSDGLHPTPMGTYLAAMVIFQRLYGTSPMELTGPGVVNGVRFDWSEDLLRLLRESAAAANAAEGQP